MKINAASKLIFAAGVCLGTFLANPAAAYTLQDDPSSTWGGDASTTTTFAGNTTTIHDLFAENLTGTPIPALSFAIPFVWPRIDGPSGPTYFPMEWRNDVAGWYTSDFNGTGVSLTVSLTNPGAGSVPMGDLADVTGGRQLPLTEPCTPGPMAPSCTPGPQPPETRSVTDAIPIISLGAFDAHELKRFDISFTYTYGDGRQGVERTAFIGNTVSAVPEPQTYFLMGAGLLVLGWRARNRRT